eukprot:ANDGO_07044.mRNA.1 hypothetical protein
MLFHRHSAVLAALLVIAGVAYGSVWPQPQSMRPGSSSVTVDPSQFSFSTTSKSQILQKAFARYATLFFPAKTARSPQGSLVSVAVQVDSDDENLQFGVDESYSISVSTDPKASISAKSVFGALRALETFSQLISYDAASQTYSIVNAPLEIDDAPRFPWRGFMVDTARHFIPVDFLLHTIDVLAYNKFNTMHWHIVDAQSFPLVSETFPLLTNAAWDPTAVYTHADVSTIVQYALERGVRVVPEFDTPGHAASFGVGYPDLVANCPVYAQNINNIPLNPAKEDTFTFIQKLFSEMLALFPDNYAHIGGDEIVFGCWLDDDSIKSFLKQKGWTASDLYRYYHQRILPMLSSLNKTPLGWEELLLDGAITSTSDPTIVHVWANRGVLAEAVSLGHKAILSAGWYLDRQQPDGTSTFYEWEDTWKVFYDNEPFKNGTQFLDPSLQKLVLGGEATMWAEQVDQANFDSRVWPRASAIAERLWSAMSVNDTTAALPRLSEWRCRMVNRGVGAGPVMPEFCRRLS